MNEAEKNRLDGIFEAISIIAEGAYVYLCDMKSDMSRWSEKAVDFFGLPGEYMHNAGKLWEEHIHPDDRETYSRNISEIFSGVSAGHDMQYRAMDADGKYVVCTCRGVVIRDAEGRPEYFGGAIRNHGILSYIDPVTGLRSLYGYLDDIRGMTYSSDPALIIMLGLSSFSDINDVYGYTFGNRVLQVLASSVQKLFSGVGAVYRMDGTRFSVISRELTTEKAAELYKQLQMMLKRDFYVDGERITLLLNGGAINVESFDIDPETFYSCLRYAYYESKHRRLGDFVVFGNIVSADNRRTLERLNVIRGCIPEDCRGFYLCYQPIVDAENEKIRGMEALLRWRNDEYGTVPPSEFINVLEQDTLFPELGRWILKRAMTDGKRFLSVFPGLVINVNLSYTQMEQEGFLAGVFSLLEETGFPPQNLCLEITERCRLLDTVMLKDMSSILRGRGIRIALDDFGTGFASLGILREMPVDTVKIDREFLKDIEKSAADKNSVKFIADLAGAFSADVCAEGIESASMRDCLREYNIACLQGYYYSKPVTAGEMMELLKK